MNAKKMWSFGSEEVQVKSI